MKPSSATGIRSFRPLNALKSIIHPPLPLTAGQSQQLLDLLKTSFREQLAASTAESGSNTANATESHRSPVDAHLNDLLKAPVFTSSNESATRTLGRVEQVRVERFIRDPIAVYREVSSQGIPTPDIAWAVLKRYTANMLSLPKEKLEDGWAVKVVLEVIKPLRILSSRIHLEDNRLRQQIIRTLVQGGDEGVAAGMLNKHWLLHISPEQPDAKVLGEIRQSIILEVTKTVETVRGLNAAATRFLAMLKNWQSNVETVLGGVDSNPFMTTGQYLLLRYAHKQDAEASQLRQKIYETCTPWIKSKFAKARLMLYYENNPYRLYGIVMHKGDLKKLTGAATICFELILSLVQHQELDKARKMISLLRTNLVGKVPGLEPALVDEVEMLLNAPGVNIRTRLVAMIAESTRRFTEETFDIMPDILEPRQKFTLA